MLPLLLPTGLPLLLLLPLGSLLSGLLLLLLLLPWALFGLLLLLLSPSLLLLLLLLLGPLLGLLRSLLPLVLLLLPPGSLLPGLLLLLLLSPLVLLLLLLLLLPAGLPQLLLQRVTGTTDAPGCHRCPPVGVPRDRLEHTLWVSRLCRSGDISPAGYLTQARTSNIFVFFEFVLG